MNVHTNISRDLVKNFKTRCEGLSPALFVFAISGNVTYALSICAASMERKYLIMNASWLAGKSGWISVDEDHTLITEDIATAGSALTVFLDLFVSYYTFSYSTND